MTDQNRGSGRTYNQLKNLPDGSIFIVHHGRMASQVRSILVQQGRRSDAIRVYPLSDLTNETLRSVHKDVAIVADHHLDDVGHHHGETWSRFLQLMLQRRGR